MKSHPYIVHDTDNVKGFFDEYRWLSNFHEAEVYFDGVLYPSSENAYQAAKTDDAEVRMRFLDLSPAKAKQLGKEVKIIPGWDRVKFDVMSSIVFDKFYRHQDLRKLLLKTGHRYLEETNHWNDTYWGVCAGKGHNNLGKVLMGIREYWGKQYPNLLGKKEPTQLF